MAVPGPGPLVDDLESLGAEVVPCRMPVLRKGALTPRGFAALVADAVAGLFPALRLIRRHASGGVYVSTITIPSWVLLARMMRRRVTIHVHEAERSAPRAVKLLLSLPTLLAHVVLVNSAYSRDVLTEALPRAGARAVVVYNGVAGPAAHSDPRAALERPVELAFVGRVSPRKGPQVAVATLAELVRRGIDARLRIAGSVFPGYEWFEQQLREQVRDAGLTRRTDFLGFVADVWEVLDRSDVVLIPSLLDEPFGNTAVEAVLAARPSVVSATSGLREASAGYPSAQAVEPGAVTDWADAVERVVADWPRYAEQARRDAEEARRRHDPARYRAEVVASVVPTFVAPVVAPGVPS